VSGRPVAASAARHIPVRQQASQRLLDSRQPALQDRDRVERLSVTSPDVRHEDHQQDDDEEIVVLKAADAIAMKLGISKTAMTRVRAGIG